MRIALALCLLAGCRATGTFACEQDDQCRRGTATGHCEAAGFCAFPDGDCPSMWRYDPTAGADFAGECVISADAAVAAVDASDWPCGVKPTSPPAMVTHDDVVSGNHTTITLTNSMLNGAALVVTTPGAALAFSTSLSIVDCICPNCIDQIEIGLIPGPRVACIYDANPTPPIACNVPVTGNAMRNFVAPATPGMYELRFRLGQDYACDMHPSWFADIPPGPDTTVAYVCVH